MDKGNSLSVDESADWPASPSQLSGAQSPAGLGDLPPFQQGYVEAALSDFRRFDLRGIGWQRECPKCVASKFCCDEHYRVGGFSDLAPETLEAMLADCEARLRHCPSEGEEHPTMGPRVKHNGARFWGWRQADQCMNFPAVTLYVGGDGEIYQTPGAQASRVAIEAGSEA